MKVSVITPTYGRAGHLEPLYRAFKSQTHPDKELLVYDDSPAPSPFFNALKDPAVRYLHSRERLTIGAKRDRLVREAQGDVIAHFDDDDYYAPHYIETMLRNLEGYDLVKLSGWFLFQVQSRQLFYWDTAEVLSWQFRLFRDHDALPVDMSYVHSRREQWIHKQLWGYGFTYVYRKELYEFVEFNQKLNMGEDHAFVLQAFRQGRRLRAVPDESALVLHVLHGTNTSGTFPNYRLPEFMIGTLFGGGALAHLRDTGHLRPSRAVEPVAEPPLTVPVDQTL